MVMCTQWATRCLRASSIGLLLLSLTTANAHGSAYSVVMNTSGLSGQNAKLAFDFVDGDGLPNNTVSLSTLNSDGTQGNASLSGDVTDVGGSGIGPWILGDASFFSELLVDFVPMGNSLSFSFTSTDNFSGGTPDSFAFFILDAETLLPLVATDDPIEGSNALFLLNIGQGSAALDVYAVLEPRGVSISVAPVPEPFTPALLAAGFAAMFARRRQG